MVVTSQTVVFLTVMAYALENSQSLHQRMEFFFYRIIVLSLKLSGIILLSFLIYFLESNRGLFIPIWYICECVLSLFACPPRNSYATPAGFVTSGGKWVAIVHGLLRCRVNPARQRQSMLIQESCSRTNKGMWDLGRASMGGRGK